MDGELSALLIANDVAEEVRTWLSNPTQGCTNLKAFANLLDSKNEVQSVILAHIPMHKESLKQRTGLKQAWREADAIVTHRLKRTAEGLQSEISDEPLPHAICNFE